MVIRPFLRLVEWCCAKTLFRRRVRTILFIVFILTAVAIQIGLVVFLLQDPSAGPHSSSNLTPLATSVDFSDSPSWKLIRDVVEIARTIRLPLFSLEAVIDLLPSDRHCQRFCSGKRWQFGTIAAFSNRREPQFVEQLQARGLQVDTVRVPNPNMVELIVELTAHFVIRFHLNDTSIIDNEPKTDLKSTSKGASTSKSSTTSFGVITDYFIIHILVFHDRPDNFWWHAPVPHDHQLRQFLIGLPYIHMAGAQPKIEIAEGILDGIEILLPAETFNEINAKSAIEFIDCNRSHAEEFFTKNNGRDSSPNTELFRIRVRKLLLKVKTLLAKHSIPFWLSSGTCLGWFRQCDVIPYTTDVDIGIFIENFKPSMIDEFSTHDLALTHVFGHPNDSYELSFLDVAEQLKLDVFFFYREKNYTWNGGTQARTGNKYKYIFPPFKMCLTEFLDLLVQVPCPTLSYIEANYGPEWRQPIRHWDWKRSPPNVRENGLWPMEQWNTLIQLFPLPPY